MAADKHLIAITSRLHEIVIFDTLSSSQRKVKDFRHEPKCYDNNFYWISHDALLDADRQRYYSLSHTQGYCEDSVVSQLQVHRISFSNEVLYHSSNFEYEQAPGAQKCQKYQTYQTHQTHQDHQDHQKTPEDTRRHQISWDVE